MSMRVLVTALCLTGPSLLAQQPATAPPPTVYFEFQVEKHVAAKPGNPAPKYPDMLRTANVEGQVLVQFVVDTTGHAEISTFRVLRSTHDLFTMAVKHALDSMEFSPAELSGRKVKQLVQMPFMFSVTPRPPSR